MSASIEVVGWCLITLGAWSMLGTSRTMSRLNRLGKCQAIEPGLRRQAWRNAAVAPSSFVWGVFWVSTRWVHDSLLWLPIAYMAVLVIAIAVVQFWFRSNDGRAAG